MGLVGCAANVYRLEYRDNKQFTRIAKAVKIMDDFKVGLVLLRNA